MHDIAGWNSILFRNARKKEFIRKNKKVLFSNTGYVILVVQ